MEMEPLNLCERSVRVPDEIMKSTLHSQREHDGAGARARGGQWEGQQAALLSVELLFLLFWHVKSESGGIC